MGLSLCSSFSRLEVGLEEPLLLDVRSSVLGLRLEGKAVAAASATGGASTTPVWVLVETTVAGNRGDSWTPPGAAVLKVEVGYDQTSAGK